MNVFSEVWSALCVVMFRGSSKAHFGVVTSTQQTSSRGHRWSQTSRDPQKQNYAVLPWLQIGKCWKPWKIRNRLTILITLSTGKHRWGMVQYPSKKMSFSLWRIFWSLRAVSKLLKFETFTWLFLNLHMLKFPYPWIEFTAAQLIITP